MFALNGAKHVLHERNYWDFPCQMKAQLLESTSGNDMEVGGVMLKEELDTDSEVCSNEPILPAKTI